MNYKAVIFDFDGTLFDSMSVWIGIGSRYLESKGLKPHDNLNDILSTMSIEQSCQYFKSTYNVSETVEEIKNEINNMVESFYFYECQPKDFVPQTLQRLHANGIKMIIATVSARYLIEAALKRMDLEKYFIDILSCSDIGAGKDNPKIFNMAVEIMQVNKKDTIVVEDSYHSIRTAKSAGFFTVGVYDDFMKDCQDKIKDLCDNYCVTLENL